MLNNFNTEQLNVHYSKEFNSYYIVAIDNTTLGPALGGCRISSHYVNLYHAISDAVGLAKGMTLKSAYAGLPFGGGKSVIMLPQHGDFSRSDLLEDFASQINMLKGKYITSLDLGATQEDVKILHKTTPFVVGLSNGFEGDDTAYYTALGVYKGIEAGLNYTFNQNSMRNRTIIVKGIGKVGLHLVKLLLKAGAHVFVYDKNERKLSTYAKELGFKPLAEKEALHMQSDVFAPCASGGTITESMAKMVNTKIICGAENVQTENATAERILIKRKIAYIPDFVANSGGVICAARMLNKISPLEVEKRIDSIYNESRYLLKNAFNLGILPSLLAEEKVSALLLDNLNKEYVK